MSLAILFHFLGAQHVLDINISIVKSLRLCCWITTSVVLFSVRCVLELWCGWFWVVNISIVKSLRLCCWITTSVVLFSVRCVLELWCGWFWVVYISIIRSLRLCCWITTSVVLFSVRCVLEIWCGWFWVVPVLLAEACNHPPHLAPRFKKEYGYISPRLGLRVLL